MPRADKPPHLAPEYAAQFGDRSVVQAYASRPPYPAALFAKLGALLPMLPARALELGAGTGDLSFDLSPYVTELVAIEPSFEMLATAVKRHASVPRNLRFVLANAEKFEPRERFSLVVAAESLHWMDWNVVLAKIARWLSDDGLLAIVTTRSLVGLPWEKELRTLISRASTNQDYRPYDLIEELTQRGLFEEQGRERFVEPFQQSVAAYVESFHSRNGFSRERMGAESALSFDEAVRALLARHGTTDIVSGQTTATLVWGRPVL